MGYQLVFEKCVERWDEALPLGNGHIGALIWGGPQTLRFSLDRTDIWDKSVPLNTERENFTYQHMVKLARAGRTDDIRTLFDAPYNHPTPTKLPAGKLLISFEKSKNIISSLDLETAEACLLIETDTEKIPVWALCHAKSKSGMIKVGCSYEQIKVHLEHPEFEHEKQKELGQYDVNDRQISQGSLKSLFYPAPVLENEDGDISFSWFSQKVDETFSFGIVMGMKKEADHTLIFYRIVSSEDGVKWIDTAKEQLCDELKLGYERCRETHIAWWCSFWNKSSIHLPDKMFEKQWYVTNYLFASCSRKGEYPMPLQGVWSADDGNLPPWKGDYHNDLNTQFSFTHFYKANHLEEGECFIDYLWESMDAARTFAKKFYGTDGICLPGVMSIDGQPLGGWPMYSLSPTCQIWLCQSFEQYYLYTGDEGFLREKAWVYFEETAKCITGLLEEKDGYYYLPVSSSPEIHDDEQASWVTPNSNYDLALLRYLFGTLSRFAKKLENGTEKLWDSILEKLPPFAVNEKQVLMISPDESLEESHRHLSNAMAICPLYLLDYDSAKEIIDATVLDYERLGTGMWVGFSFAWMSHLYSIQGNGEGAREQLRIFWESFCSPNGFHLNGDYKKRGYSTFHYRPFTLESNMYAADALQEMLLQIHHDVVHIFPAIPEDWEKEEIAFSGFRGNYGMSINGQWCPENGYKVEIYSPISRHLKIKIGSQIVGEMDINAGETAYAFFEQNHNMFG